MAVPTSIRDGRRADEGGRRHDVELVGDLRRPDRVQAGLVGPAGVSLELLHLGGVATPVGAHLKTDPHPEPPLSPEMAFSSTVHRAIASC